MYPILRSSRNRTTQTVVARGRAAACRTTYGAVLLSCLALMVAACRAPVGYSNYDDATGLPPDSDQSEVSFSPPDGGACNADAACAITSAEATLVPLLVYIVFDRSLSMNNGGKWAHAIEALSKFFAAPDAAGLRVALDVFPKNTSSCSPSSYMNPLVPPATLSAAPAPEDSHEAALSEALASTSPGGSGTPVHAALAGAMYRARAQLSAHPEQHPVVLLVTDGEPQGCAEGESAIEQLVRDAANDGISTYAIGLEGANEKTLNVIAEAGSGGQALMVGSDNLNEELLSALDAIRHSAMPCSFEIPATDPDAPLAVDAVNVCYTHPNEDPQTLPQAHQTVGCEGGEGWHYDDAVDPQEIILCPKSCARAQAQLNGQVDVVFGCETTIK